jgi:hypothetical protein
MFEAMKKYWPLNLIVGCLLANMAAFIFLPDREGVFEDTKIVLVFSSAFMVTGSLLTALLCRYKTRHQGQISYKLVFPAGLVIAIFTMFCGFLVVDGMKVFTADFWIAMWQWRIPWLGLWLLGFAVSMLVAFGIVVYYRRQQQRDDTHMA